MLFIGCLQQSKKECMDWLECWNMLFIGCLQLYLAESADSAECWNMLFIGCLQLKEGGFQACYKC